MMKDSNPSTDNKAEEGVPSGIEDGIQEDNAATTDERETEVVNAGDEVVAPAKAPKRKKPATIRGKSRKTTRGRKTSVFSAKSKTHAPKDGQTSGGGELPTAKSDSDVAQLDEIALNDSAEVEEHMNTKTSTKMRRTTSVGSITSAGLAPQEPRKKKNIGSIVSADIFFCLAMVGVGIAILVMRGDLVEKYVAPYEAKIKKLEVVIDPALKKKKKAARVFHTGFTNQNAPVEVEPEPEFEPPLPSPQEVKQAKVQIVKVRQSRTMHETYIRRIVYVGVAALIVAVLGIVANILLSNRQVVGFSLAWVAVVLTGGSILLMGPIVVVPAAFKAAWLTAVLVLVLLVRVCWNIYYGVSLYGVKDEFEAMEKQSAVAAAPTQPHGLSRARPKTQIGRKPTISVSSQKRESRQQVVLAGSERKRR